MGLPRYGQTNINTPSLPTSSRTTPRSPRSSKQCTPRSRKPPDALSRSHASLTKRAIFLLDAAVYSRSLERARHLTTVHHYLQSCALNRLKHGRLELSHAHRQLTHVRRTYGTTTDTVAKALHAVADFYNRLYLSASSLLNIIASGPLTTPITAADLRQACSRIRGNTSPGIDHIPSRVAKLCVPQVADCLALLINAMFAADQFPPDFVHARTILLHKKGDATDISNYRPISLLPTIYKVLTRVITS
uniref:Uncharacterized protein n=1 Tax=Plectus sambesii TaxID=2011161 RepID=A0A914UV01_9BILA